MRTNKTKRQFVTNFARIALLAVCFTLVFAFALAQDAFGIAEAGTQSFIEKDDDAAIGSAAPIFGDNGELTALHFGFPGKGKEEETGKWTQWTYTEEFKTISPTLGNHRVAKNDGNTKLYTWTNGISNNGSETGKWKFGVSNANNGNATICVINYNVGSFISNLLLRSDIKVYASFGVTLQLAGENQETKAWKAVASAQGEVPEDPAHVPVYFLNWGAYDWTWDMSHGGDTSRGYKTEKNKLTEATSHTSNEVELTSDKQILSIILGNSWDNKIGSSRDVNMTVSNLTVTIRIQMDYSMTDKSDFTIVDGSAPQVASQYVADVNDTYSPYLPTVDETTGSSSWPIWYESIAGQLSRYTDEVSYANGKLSSFTNTPMGTVNNKSYYKQSVVRYVDSYDYSSSGGFSGATLQSVYSQAIAQGKTAAEAETAVKAVLPYMSLGERKVSSVDMANLDIINPAKNITWTSNENDRFVSGIKTVQIGDAWKDMDNQTTQGAVLNVADIQVSTSVTKYPKTHAIYVDGAEVGYVSVIKYNRAEIVVTIYMYTNARVRTVVTDNGGASNETVVTYSGIDTSAPTVGDSASGATNSGIQMDLSDYIASNANKDTLKWVRKTEMSYSAGVEPYEDDSAAGFSPYIWFYSVDKANSWTELANKPKKEINNLTALKSANILPIAYGSVNNFAYDFYNGLAQSYGSSAFDAKNPEGMETANGAGYYRFTFYTFDLAGNKGGEVQYFVKVDFDQPTYSATMSFVDENGQTIDITPSENGKWATGKTTLSLYFETPNFSGMSLVFEDVNSTYMIVLDGYGAPAYGLAGGGNIVKYCAGNSTIVPSGSEFDITIESNLQPITAHVKVSRPGNSVQIDFVFDDASKTVAFISEFTAYAGQYNATTDPDADEMMLAYADRSWGSAIQVLIDRTNPVNPELHDVGDTQYLFPLDGKYELPTERTWYTDGYNFDTALTFIEYLIGGDYARGIKVYTGIKNVFDAQGLDSLKNLNIESAYKTINEDNFKEYFDRLQVVSGDLLDGDQTEITLNFIKEKGASMRVLYAWVVDQAGNFSGLNIYYILVDGNTYTVNSTVYTNTLLGKTASISQTDVEEMATTSFKRGEQVMLNIGVENGYVPFTLTRKNQGLDDVQLLSNYSPNTVWQSANADYARFVFSDGDYSKVAYTLDDPFTVGNLPSVTTLEFAHRQVIEYQLTNKQVSYTSQQLVLPMTLNNDLSRSVIEFVYVDEANNVLYRKADGTATTIVEEAEEIDGVKQLFVPVAVGEYFVRVFIRKDNPNFVTDDFAMDEDGEQVFAPISVSIIKGNAVIIAKTTRSVYGDLINGKLEYELQGVSQDNLASEGIRFSLALNAVEPANRLYPVGTYQIVVNGLTNDYANYNVSFVSATHTVSRRNIKIHTWQATKVYGDEDPEFLFGVGSAQFEGFSVNVQDLLQKIFGDFGYEKAGNGELVVGGEQFQLYKAGTRISRMSGEAVGEYDYVPNIALFDINNNFSLTIDNTQHFYITKRTVTVDVSGQSSVFPFGATVDASTIKPTYTLSANDRVVENDVAQLIEGKLSLGNFTSESDPAYSDKRAYAILLATAENANIKIELGEGAVYIVYIALQNSVTVSLMDGESIEFGYGLIWNNQGTLLFDREKFAVVGENVPVFTNIVWTASIQSTDAMPNAGRHLVKITDAKLIGEDGSELADAVFVNTFVITINPAVITVSATVQNNQKTYGNEDKDFGIGFAIDSVNNKPFADGDTFANLTYQAILETLSGSFARATYSKVGDFRAIGSRFDSATGAGNTVLATDGDYYGLAVEKAFASSNKNFIVQADVDADQRFIINPKEVVLNTKYFVGISKSYDGTTDVPYSESQKPYDLSRSDLGILVRTEDKLELLFTASYGSIGSVTQATETFILFSNISLGGDSAHNYKLTKLFNEGINADVNNGAVGPFDIDQDTTIKIHYTDNINGGVDNRIKILMAQIGLLKSDVTISKQYDNTKNMTIDCIQIADSQATTVLRQILNRKDNPAVIVEEATSSFSGVNVSDNYNIPIITIFFPIDNPASIPILKDGDYAENEVSIEPGRHQNMDGLRVKLSNMQAKITKRTLDAKSFDTIEAVNRDYNGTPYVDTTFTFKEEALAQGDTSSTVNLHLMAQTSKGEVVPGEYTVNIAELSATNDGIMTYVGNQNYTVDVESLNVANELKVVISRAKLLPNINFKDREYDNSADVEAEVGEGTPLTTLHYSSNLQEELSHFSIVGNVSYTLSANGQPDANVTDDLLHNVLVNGLMIHEEGGNNYLKNYELYGERYAGGQYNSVGTVLVDEVIADYELIDIVTISKRYVPIISNNVVIKDKVYDGTKNAVVEVDLPEEYIVPEHIGKLTIIANGEFSRRQVGNNIGVSINSVQLVALTEDGNAFINNYQLADYRGKHVGNIVPKPIVLNANLGEKEYDGFTDISKSSIQYSYDGILPIDEANYAVQTRGGAYYIDSDVNVERDENDVPVYYADAELTQKLFYKEVDGEGHYYVDEACTEHADRKFARVLSKSGTIYNPKLANIKEAYINYVLTQASTEATSNYIAFKTADGNMHYYETASADDTVVEYYSPLPTTTKYIHIPSTADDNEAIQAIERAKDAGAIVGYYGSEGKRGYLIKQDYEDSAVKIMPNGEVIVYFQAEGKIAQRYAYIKSDGIRKTDKANDSASESAFTKQYDATKKFFGTRVDGKDGDGDYYYVNGSISNIIGDDDVEIEDVFAEFDSADTNAMYVTFTVSGIHGADAYKYTTGGASATTRLRASIVKREIDAHLADGEMVYGTNPSNVNGNITYTLNGHDITWVAEEGSFFMNYKEYLVALGFIANVDDKVAQEDFAYLADSRDRTYNKNAETGLYEKVPEGEVGEFIRFRGSFSALPRATATFASSRPNVGDQSLVYKLVGGDSTNFVFTYNYTDSTGTGTSNLEVIKKDLYIAIQGNDFTKVYGEADKVIELQYLDKNGNKGIVNGDTWMTLFKDGNVDYRPVAYLAIYNIETGECTPVNQYARISADLGENEYYVYCLKEPDGVNYAEFVKNYNVIFGTLTYVFAKDDLGNEMVDATGKKLIQPMFEYEGTSIKPKTAQLTIVLPKLTNVSVKSENNTFVYDSSLSGGMNNVKKVLYGLEFDDIVTYITKNEDGTYSNINVTNVGNYVGYLKVQRFVKIDGEDPNGYLIEWMSENEVTITIEKADIALKANPVLSAYNGREQVYQMVGNDAKISYKNVQIEDPYSEFDLKIEKLVDGEYVEAKLCDAGTYRLTISPNERFSKLHTNQKAETVQTIYTISRAVVNIDLDTDGFTKSAIAGAGIKLTAVYDADANYDLDYTVTMSGDVDESIVIGKDDTDFIVSKAINQPGRYSFDVQIVNSELNKDNYNIVGGYGTIELSTQTLSSNNSGIQIEGTGVVANRLVVTEITQGVGTASDAALLETVKSYMPLISKEAELDFTPEVVAVLDVKLYCDGNTVSLEGKQTKMSIALPKDIDNLDGIAVYTVTEQGTLKRLTDFTVANGNIEYTTDYLGALVFVDLTEEGLASWIIYLIVSIAVLLAVAVVVTLITYFVRKFKLKKLM